MLLSVCVTWVVIISPASANENRKVAILSFLTIDEIDQGLQQLIKEEIYLGALQAMKPDDQNLLLSAETTSALLSDMGIDIAESFVEAWAEVEVGRALAVDYVVSYFQYYFEPEDQIIGTVTSTPGQQ